MSSQQVLPGLVAETELPTTITEKKEDRTGDKESSDENSSEDTSQYVTGVKLYSVIGGLTMVAFLMMLDSTIVTTVCAVHITLSYLHLTECIGTS